MRGNPVTIDSPTREILDRRRRIWERSPDLHYDQVCELAAVEVETERADEAARQATTREMSDSLNLMWSCPICGGDAVNQAACDDCLRTEQAIRNERALTKPVAGQDRRPLVEAWMERLGR